MAKIKLVLDKYSGDIDKRLDYLSPGSVFDVFSDTFMKAYTKHENFTDFCQAIGCDMTSQNDLEKLDNGEFDHPISTQSDFLSWEDMTETAYQLKIEKN